MQLVNQCREDCKKLQMALIPALMETKPKLIYNFHHGNGVPAMFTS